MWVADTPAEEANAASKPSRRRVVVQNVRDVFWYGHLMDGLDDQIALHLDTRAQAAAPPPHPERNRDPPGIGP